MEDSSLTIPCLSLDLIAEILSRLPVKSLLQFKSVSKSWFSLISSPEFINSHFSVSSNNEDYSYHRLMLHCYCGPKSTLKDCSLSSLLYGSVTDAFDLDYPIKSSNQSISIVGSFNGLVCFSAIEENCLFLWNPSLRKFKKLPDSRPSFRCRYFSIYGFGYDEFNDDYKVVCIFCTLEFDTSDDVEVKIYGMKSDSWKKIDDGQAWRLKNDSGKFVKGKLHWVSVGVDNNWDISYLDLTDEKWGKLEQPCHVDRKVDFQLGVLRQDLSVICNYNRTWADVWVMKESWTKVYIITYENNPGYGLFLPPICMSRKDEILLMCGSTFIIYNPNDGSVKYPAMINFDGCLLAESYVESLVWPFSQTESRTQQE